MSWRERGLSSLDNTMREDDVTDDDDDDDDGDEENLQNVMSLCKESSSGLMATVSSLRSTIQTSKRTSAEESGGEEGVGVCRGREWGEMDPLTLQVVGEALAEQEPHLPALTHTNATTTTAHVKTLSLQFKGLGSLDFLWMLTNLTHLEVSNNSLTHTKGLERLSMLTWLDLSFNQVSEVGGLGSLRRLEVLALHNNCLEGLERGALQPLARLHVLTLANNSISSMDDVRTLRQVRSLASLSLANNPLCDHHYPARVLAYLPALVYLDHRRLSHHQHTHAATLYRSEVAVVEAEEEKARKQEEQEVVTRTSQEHHRRAGVLALNDGSLFARMFRGDKDMGVLLHLPGANSLMTKYRDQFNAVCLRVFNAGLAHDDQRQTELRLLQDALHAAKNNADTHARGMHTRRGLRRQWHSGNSLTPCWMMPHKSSSLPRSHSLTKSRSVSTVDEYNDMNCGLRIKLWHLQYYVQCSTSEACGTLWSSHFLSVQDVIDRAREELGTLVGNFLEAAAMDLQEGRRLAYTFYCRLRELTAKVVEDGGVGSSKGVDEERTARVFEGSDTLTSALAGIHDRHLALIDSREVDLRHHLQHWLTHTLQEISKAEWVRHRRRVEEITTLTARQRQLLYDALPSIHE
ncbi:dynein regulatory complex subunit 3 isoform X1 [Procambarus clarkii]|uniref:dynein regulatory complex subunit 3 isoform X1 n=1 Tax=Procambarus clarkii TaxID=6728 RepID=UPI001E672F0F|nr:dynein regulatory complex subunit 3-like isoform X1 [Procambarus clarkii]